MRPTSWPKPLDGPIHCPACDRELGTATTHHDDLPVEGHGSAVVPVGVTVRLAPGFVNARRRHVSGMRWFVFGKDPKSPSPDVRLPAVVSCRCEQDVLLDHNGDGYRQFATTALDTLHTVRVVGGKSAD